MIILTLIGWTIAAIAIFFVVGWSMTFIDWVFEDHSKNKTEAHDDKIR